MGAILVHCRLLCAGVGFGFHSYSHCCCCCCWACLGTAGRRFCCCRLRTDVRGGNPRFDINRSTPLSDRCSPSFAKAALSTAPLRNVKLLSLSTKVALFSSQVFRSWSFTVFRRCVSVRRVVGITLLTLTVVATDFK